MNETATELLNSLPTTSRRKLMLLFAAVLKIDLAMASERWAPVLAARWPSEKDRPDPFERLWETAARIDHMADDPTGRADRELMGEAWYEVKFLAVDEQDFECAARIRDRQDHIRLRSATKELDQVRALCAGGVLDIEPRRSPGSTPPLHNPTREQRDEYARHLIRDIYNFDGPRIRRLLRWRTTDTVDVARAIYEDRAFDRLPILADALMDAGCDNEGILSHCRSEGPHVRGCWVVDLVLGKE